MLMAAVEMTMIKGAYTPGLMAPKDRIRPSEAAQHQEALEVAWEQFRYWRTSGLSIWDMLEAIGASSAAGSGIEGVVNQIARAYRATKIGAPLLRDTAGRGNWEE